VRSSNTVWALLLLLASAAPAVAQFERSSISGTVKDQQGGVMPGVTVTVTNTQTQQLQTTITNGTGFYTFPNLLPGRYDIAAELVASRKRVARTCPLTRRARSRSTSRWRPAPSAKR
jgi:carboxypeptidase family protein